MVVIGYDHDSQVATARCRCNNVEDFARAALVGGKVTCCRGCRARAKYIESITVDLKRLDGLEPECAAKVLRRFARHLEAYLANEVEATSFAIFVTEALAANFEDEPALSFEERLVMSNPQRYRVYEPPTI